MALDEPPGTEMEALSDSGMGTEEIPGIATPTWLAICCFGEFESRRGLNRRDNPVRTRKLSHWTRKDTTESC